MRAELEAAGSDWPARGLFCAHCNQPIPQFAELSEADEQRVRELIRQLRRIMAVTELRCLMPDAFLDGLSEEAKTEDWRRSLLKHGASGRKRVLVALRGSSLGPAGQPTGAPVLRISGMAPGWANEQ